jgi:hypothetical protein
LVGGAARSMMRPIYSNRIHFLFRATTAANHADICASTKDHIPFIAL